MPAGDLSSHAAVARSLAVFAVLLAAHMYFKGVAAAGADGVRGHRSVQRGSG